jgi:hypothetical protein
MVVRRKIAMSLAEDVWASAGAATGFFVILAEQVFRERDLRLMFFYH